MSTWRQRYVRIKGNSGASGLADRSIIMHAKPGAVFLVEDESINFATDRLPDAGARTEHEKRRVIVIQALPLCSSAAPVTIYVVPCSASSREVTAVPPYSVEIPVGEPGFTKKAVAYTAQVQSILKRDLTKHVGDISAEKLLEIQTVLARNLGLVGQNAVALPSAEGAGPVASAKVPASVTPLALVQTGDVPSEE